MTVQALTLEGSMLGVPAAGGAVVRERPRLRVVRDDEVRVEAPLRLTARGRLVRTLLVFGAVSLVALMVWARLTAAVLPETHSVTVEAGQTLSQIAADELPMVPLEAAVVRIQVANGMSGTSVVAGQDLVIPGSSH